MQKLDAIRKILDRSMHNTLTQTNTYSSQQIRDIRALLGKQEKEYKQAEKFCATIKTFKQLMDQM